MIVRYCSCFLCCFIFLFLPFPPLGTTWVEAAEGETKISIAITA